MVNINNWKEKDLFAYLKTHHSPELGKIDETYSRWDCISKDEIIELKCRRVHYPTMLIEKKKYDALQLEASRHKNYKAVYINSTPKGIYKWVLDSTLPIEWLVEHKHPATTAFGNRSIVAKEVGYLDVTKASTLYSS